MKLIIDVPEKIEEYIKDYIPIGAGDNVFCYPDEIVRMIQNGTPIPDNATFGDVIEKITNRKPLEDNKDAENIIISTKLWNAPYQKGGKE